MICEKCGKEYEGTVCGCEVEINTVNDKKIELPAKKTSALGITGMIFGIISMILLVTSIPSNIIYTIFAIPFISLPGHAFGLVIAIIGMILSSIGRKKLPTDKLAKAGKVLSLICIIARVTAIVAVIAFVLVSFILGLVFGIGGAFLTPDVLYDIETIISEIFREIGYILE